MRDMICHSNYRTGICSREVVIIGQLVACLDALLTGKECHTGSTLDNPMQVLVFVLYCLQGAGKQGGWIAYHFSIEQLGSHESKNRTIWVKT